MTATAFADLLHARRTGPGRWAAKCPAHRDRSPSLSIGEGRDGRVLVVCFAGCTVTEILAAMNLSLRDLFAGPPPSPEQLARLAHQRAAEEAQQARLRKGRLAALERVRKLEAVRDSVGGKLMLHPDDDALARLFGEALERLRDAEAVQNERPVASGPEGDIQNA